MKNAIDEVSAGANNIHVLKCRVELLHFGAAARISTYEGKLYIKTVKL